RVLHDPEVLAQTRAPEGRLDRSDDVVAAQPRNIPPDGNRHVQRVRGGELVSTAMPELRVRPLGPPRTLAASTMPARIEVQRLLSRASLSATSNHDGYDTGDGDFCQEQTDGEQSQFSREVGRPATKAADLEPLP